MIMFKVYQLLCCIICCELLHPFPQFVHGKKKREKALKRYLDTLKKAHDIFFNQNTKFDDFESELNPFHKTRNRKARYRRKRNVHVNYASRMSMALPTNVVRCRIFCRSGLYLQLLPDGLVRGTPNQMDKNTFLELQSFGPSLVRIKGLYSRKYLSIDRNGRLKALGRPHLEESLFKEVQEENWYNTYSSFKYYFDEPYDIFLGIRSTGQVKKTWKAYPGQTATQFLVIRSL